MAILPSGLLALMGGALLLAGLILPIFLLKGRARTVFLGVVGGLLGLAVLGVGAVAMLGLFVTPVLVLAGLVVAGLVALTVLLKGPARWVVGSVLGGVAVLAVLAFFIAMPVATMRQTARSHARRHAVEAEIEQARRRARAAEAPARAVAGGTRTPHVESGVPDDLPFLADVYPSKARAVEAVAMDVARSAERVLAGSADANAAVTGQASTEVLQRVAAVLRDRTLLDGAAVVSPSDAGHRDDADVVCTVLVDGESEGTVRVVLGGPGEEVSRSARYVDKPWAANFARYLAGAEPGLVMVRSPRPAADAAEADGDLADAAVDAVLPHLKDAVAGKAAAAGGAAGVDDADLRRAARRALRSRGLVRDRFIQRFDRPYGALYRTAMLLDVSPENLDRVAAELVTVSTRTRRTVVATWWRLASSIGALAVLIFAAYLVLNAATKGYYAWLLRLAAVVVVVGGVLFLLVLS